jgi:hypothetical protein
MKKNTFFTLCFSFIMGSIFAQGPIWVKATSTGNGSGDDEANATTWTDGLSKIADGGVLRVVGTIAAGSQNLSSKEFTYTIEGDANGSTLTGTDAAVRMFTINDKANQNVTFRNIIFTGSTNSTGAGGGVFYCNTNATLTFENCVFNGNSINNIAGGGAIFITGSTSLSVTGSTFYNNSALLATGQGGAVVVQGALSAVFTNCTFFNNKLTARSDRNFGAAIRVNVSAPTTVINCLFYNNTASTGLTSDFTGTTTSVRVITNSFAQYVNNTAFPTYTNNSSTINDSDFLASSTLTWNGTLNKVTFTAPSLLTDATPIDFGNDNSDVGSWDSKINLFKGTTNSDWATGSNWSSTAAPTSLENVTLLSDSPSLVVGGSTNATINNLSVDASSSLTINSGGSLIVNGTSTGNVTYNRNLGTNNWYLVSSPVSGQVYNDAYVTANGIASGTSSNRGIASYTTADNTWSYFQAGGNSTFNNGQGYSEKRTASGDISFTGTINTADVSVAVSNASNGFNLVGNPFTSHVNSASFLTDNAANLVSETIWVWNQATENYETKVTVDAFVLVPTQGFFVRSSNGTNLNIAESYQASTGGTFQKTSKTEITLTMTDGSNNRFAKMYFLDNATKGFDNGFDGETFGGIENTVDVFTNLVENNEGKKYQVQSLPIDEMETMIVPVGVKAAAGKEITFTAEAINLPGDVKVFLEDRVTNTFTRLDEANSSYKVTLNDALNGTGRFFLHTKSSAVLSTDDVVLQNTSVYAINNNTLKVVGLPSGNATVKMYSILGKQVMQTSFSSTGVKEISLPKLSTGMYIVQVATATGKLNKKIVLE